jgi:hypothetical protein
MMARNPSDPHAIIRRFHGHLQQGRDCFGPCGRKGGGRGLPVLIFPGGAEKGRGVDSEAYETSGGDGGFLAGVAFDFHFASEAFHAFALLTKTFRG